jgi:hypothetical protein
LKEEIEKLKKMKMVKDNVEQPAYFFRTSVVNGRKYYNTKSVNLSRYKSKVC